MFFPFTAAPRAKGALACTGAAQGRRAALAACVCRSFGTNRLTGSLIQASVVFSEITIHSVIPDA